MTIINYDWDELEDNIVEEYDDAGATVAEYTTEPAQFGNVISQHRSGQDSYYHYDGQGSTLALSGTNGDLTDTYAYSSFGDVTAHTGSSANPFQYGGRKQYYRDTETAQYDVRRRTLSPSTARWLSEDILGVLLSNNAYRYVANRPHIMLDPTGLRETDDRVQGPNVCLLDSAPVINTYVNLIIAQLRKKHFGDCKGTFTDAQREAFVLNVYEVLGKQVPNTGIGAFTDKGNIAPLRTHRKITSLVFAA